MSIINTIKEKLTTGRKPEYLRVGGKIMFPYTILDAVLDEDDKSLKDKLSELMLEFKSVKDSVANGSLAGPQGPKGDTGANVILKEDNGYVKWKLDNEDDNSWKELFKISDLSNNTGSSSSVDIIDNLTTNDGTKALSAKQGYLLQEAMKQLMEFVKDKHENPDNDVNDRLVSSNLVPGLIDSENHLVVEPDDWTINYYEPVESGEFYTLYLPNEARKIIVSYYGIDSSGEMEFKYSEAFFKMMEIDLDIPEDVYFIKIGFNTKNPKNMIINYRLEKN